MKTIGERKILERRDSPRREGIQIRAMKIHSSRKRHLGVSRLSEQWIHQRYV